MIEWIRYRLATLANPLIRLARRQLVTTAIREGGPQTTHDGISIIQVMRSEHDSALLLRRVQSALELLQNTQGPWFTRLKRHCPRVYLVHTSGGPGEYWVDRKACVLDIHWLVERNTMLTAATLVHEAAHARIRAFGIRYRPSRHLLVERICTKAEFRFLSMLPDDAEVELEEVRERLSHYQRP